MGTGPILPGNSQAAANSQAHWNSPGTVTGPVENPAGQIPGINVPPPAPQGGGVTADVNLDDVEDVDIESVNVWNHGEAKAQGLTFRSWGDPHEVSGDGLKFDNYQRGTFTKLMSATGDFMLQTRQDPWIKNPSVTVNTAAAVKSGKDIVSFDAKTNELMINGRKVALEPGATYPLPGGGSVKVNAPTAEQDAADIIGTIDITTDKGDFVQIERKQSNKIRNAQGELVEVSGDERYIDIRGAVSPNRKDGEVRGSLGAIDRDTDASNDMVGRDGKVYKINPKDQQAVDKFLDEWRANTAEDLLLINNDMHGFRESFDVDGDGKYAIVDDGMGGFKEAYDLNKDGALTMQEYIVASARIRAMGHSSSIATHLVEGNAKLFDRNKDGTLTDAEYFKNALGWDITDFFKTEEKEEEEPKDQPVAAPAPQPQ